MAKNHSDLNPFIKVKRITGAPDYSMASVQAELLDRVMSERPILGRLVAGSDIARVRRAHRAASLGNSTPQIDHMGDTEIMPVDTFMRLGS